jgi:hypothetical protein
MSFEASSRSPGWDEACNKKCNLRALLPLVCTTTKGGVMRERDAIRDMWAFEEQKQSAIDSLDAMLTVRSGESVDESQERVELFAVAQAAKLALEAAAAGLGECRQATPYAALYPLIDGNGDFKWCCTHETTHCSS